ncbi:hypothetical protein, partial [Allomuricauda sp. d1]|uniref:hypothetical protein n=1 Tax=Allomuricauda sp. d1 TaxID=3136725 RepID=UPI0031D848C6
MKKLITFILFVFLSGIAFSQTTVTLQDQCNCEVLSGTAVSAPGATTPAGADAGDIYVNTTTGTIFFWDGDSWELTSGNDTNTTNASLTEDGVNLILRDSDNNTVTIPLADIAAVVDTNTTNVAFTVNTGTGQLEITDSESNTLFVSLADLAAAIDTDDQTLTEVLAQGNSAGGNPITDLDDPTDPQDAATKNYVDNLSVDDADAIIGNEVTDATNGTLVRSGSGTTGDPFTLGVATDGITTNEILDGTIASGDIAADAVNAATINADVAGSGLTQNGSGALEVDVSSLAGDGDITSTDSTIDITGGTDAAFTDVTLDVADDAITTDKILDGTIASGDIAADAVNAATINADVAGSGLTQNGSGALEVDVSSLAGDGDITSTDSTIDITGGTDAAFNDVTLDVADDAITTDKIAAGAVESSDIAADAVNAATINA